MSKRKKSEMHNRARRLLGAFASEARKQAFACEQKKVIRAQYENGLLLLKEDFVRLPYAQIQSGLSPTALSNSPANLPVQPTKAMQLLFSRAKAPPAPDTSIDVQQLTGKEKLHLVLGEIVRMYYLEFKIIDELMAILKSELQKF